MSPFCIMIGRVNISSKLKPNSLDEMRVQIVTYFIHEALWSNQIQVDNLSKINRMTELMFCKKLRWVLTSSERLIKQSNCLFSLKFF
jgi:uncharacterized membrane protein